MAFLVESRARRTNPEQEKIVSEKDDLNSRTSKLIRLLIDTKKSWNGKPSPGIGISEKTPITEPLPPQTESAAKMIQQLADEILSELSQVSKDQFEYSQKRKLPKSPVVPSAAPIQSFFEENKFQKFSSNIFSRILSHIYAPFQSETNKWERLRLLRSLAQMEHNLREINDLVLTSAQSSPDAILRANYKLREFYTDAKATFLDPIREKVVKLSSSVNEKIDTEKQKAITENRPEDASEFDRINESPKDAPERGKYKTEKERKEKEEKTKEKIKNKSKKPSQKKEVPTTEVPIQAPPKHIKWKKKPDGYQTITEPNESRTLDEFFGGKFDDFFFVYKDNGNVYQALFELKDVLIGYKAALQNSIDVREVYVENAEDTGFSQEKLILDVSKKLIHELDSIISGISLQIEEEDAGLKRLKSYSIKDVQKNIQKFEEDLFRVFSNDLFLQAFVITFSIDEQDAGETHVKRILSELKDPEMIYMTEEPSVYENVLKNFKKVLHENSRNLYHIEVHPKIKQIISMIQQPLSKAAASNPLSRWYHRMRTTWSFENDRHVRLAMDKAINTCVHKINYTMDLLEKSPLDFKGLIKQAKSILISMETVFNKMIDLVEMYNAGMRIQDSNKKLQKQKPLHDEIPIRELASLRRHESDIRGDIKLIEALENKAENISFAMEN